MVARRVTHTLESLWPLAEARKSRVVLTIGRAHKEESKRTLDMPKWADEFIIYNQDSVIIVL